MEIKEEKINPAQLIAEITPEQNEICDHLRLLTQINKKVVLMGRTGSGKSTLANHLTGVKLSVMRQEDGTELLSGGVGIGNHTGSSTTIPDFFYTPEKDTVFIDCPGGGDVRSLSQEVKNAFFVQTLFNGRNETCGINNFIFALVVRDCDIVTQGRAKGLREAVFDLASLAGNAVTKEDILQNTILIVTQAERTPEQVSKTLAQVGAEIAQNGMDRGVNTVISRLANNVNNIFTFPKPTPNQETYAPHTRVAVLKWLANDSLTPPIPMLNAQIALSGKVHQAILELKETLKEDVITKEKALITSLQQDFICSIEQPVTITNDLTAAQCGPYMETCVQTKKQLIEFSSRLTRLISDKRRLNNSRDIISVDLQLLRNLLDLGVPQKIVEHQAREYEYQNIVQQLIQLKSCADIENSSAYNLVNYDGLRNVIAEFCNTIQRTEVVLLQRKFILLNEDFKTALDELSKTIIESLEDKNITFDALIQLYLSFKAVMGHFTADNDGSAPNKRLLKFRNMLSEYLVEAIKTLPSHEKFLPKVDKIIGITASYVDLQEQYSTMLNNTIAHTSYLDLFRTSYAAIIEAFETKVRYFISLDLQEIAGVVTGASKVVIKIYDDCREIESKEEDIPNTIPFIRRLHHFFLETSKQDASAKAANQQAIIGLSSIRKDLDPTRLARAEGLMKLGYTFQILTDLVQQIMTDQQSLKRHILTMKDKIEFLLSLIVEKNIPEEIMNIPDTSHILNTVLDLSDNKTYQRLVNKYMRYLSTSLKVEIKEFWAQFLAQISKSTPEGKLAVLRALNEFSVKTNQINALNEFKTHVSGCQPQFDSVLFESIVSKCQLGLAFYKDNENVVAETGLIEIHIHGLTVTIAEQLKILTDESLEKSIDLITALETEITNFKTVIDRFSVNHPLVVCQMLKSIKKTHNNLAPWEMGSAFENYRTTHSGLVHLNLEGLHNINRLYQQYCNFSNTNPVIRIDLEKIETIRLTFWNNLNDTLLQRDIGCLSALSRGLRLTFYGAQTVAARVSPSAPPPAPAFAYAVESSNTYDY